MNVIKMAKLAMLNRGMWQLYGDVMGGRQADNIDHVLGRELDGLIAAAPDANLSREETRRIRRKHREDPNSIWCAVCRFGIRSAGRAAIARRGMSIIVETGNYCRSFLWLCAAT